MAPSLTTFFTFGTLLATSLAAPAAQAPPPPPPAAASAPPAPVRASQLNGRPAPGPPSPWHRYSTSQMQGLKSAMPTLPGLAPTNNVTLYVPVLGVGTQNYTCNGTAFVQTEPSSGALATLHDITDLLMRDPSSVATLSQRYADNNGRLPGLGPQIGLHYFSEDNVPVFNLTASPDQAVLAGAKIGAVDAPDAESDVPWLFLRDAPNGVSRKLNTVYRVDTEKGVIGRSQCTEEGKTVEKPYIAQYWFYE